MKGFLIANRGTEHIASMEVKELIDAKTQVNEACVVFSVKEHQELFKLCYKAQSAVGIFYLLSEFEHKDIFSDFKINVQKIDFTEWLSKNSTFRIKCKKDSKAEITTPEMEKKLGEIIINHIKNKRNYKQKVDLTNPDTVIFVYLMSKKCYIGIDFSGFDLSKRAYNIFTHPAAVRGTIAYSLVRLSGYKKNETLLDCFSGSGIIPIEAALFASNFPANFYNKEKFAFLKLNKFNNYDFSSFFKKIDDEIKNEKLNIYNVDSSMKYINYAKKNSKIAGIEKCINFSRTDIEWLDTKFDKGKIDKIVTKMPLSQSKDSDKIYNEFFYQAEFILSREGKIALIGKKESIEKFAPKHNFKIMNKGNAFSGKGEYNIFVLARCK